MKKNVVSMGKRRKSAAVDQAIVVKPKEQGNKIGITAEENVDRYVKYMKLMISVIQSFNYFHANIIKI